MKLFFKLFIFLLGLSLIYQFYGEDVIKRASENSNVRSNPPAQSNVNVAHSLEFPRSSDGHYWMVMNVENTKVTFIVDTGASMVTLSHRDAEKLNLRLNDQDYSMPVRTAAGMSTVAEVEIGRMSVGALELYNVKAFVAREGMLATSLLGMNFLNRLKRFEFAGNKLVLEQ